MNRARAMTKEASASPSDPRVSTISVRAPAISLNASARTRCIPMRNQTAEARMPFVDM
jgi:hypothetical protein